MQLTTTLYIVITGIYEVAITELQYFAALVYIAIYSWLFIACIFAKIYNK